MDTGFLKMRAALIAMAGGTMLLGACTEDAPPRAPVETEVPEELSRNNSEAPAAIPVDAEGYEGATPMEERVATLGLLNKRNNISQDIELTVGESRRLGDVIVRLSACERSLPWEMPKETGAFVQVLVRSAEDDDQWGKVFSGWLFKNSPSLNVVEHRVYDVWVKDCAMSFPGESARESAASPSSDSNDSGSE